MFLGLKTLITIARKRKGIEDSEQDGLDEAIASAGYAYDANQDIFYSTMDAWQRNMGYCRLYDESAAPTGMIVDCEPIYFKYKDKIWLIELWKGQYDLTTGCEIGVYVSEWTMLNIHSVYKGLFYHSASNDDLLEMSFTLKKNGVTLIERKDKHWWLTGFKLGEFSEPHELIMEVSITLKDEEMRKAFVQGLKKAGYTMNDISIKENENIVSLVFNKPRTPQPLTRMVITDWIIQKKNKYLCDKYQDISIPFNNFTDKLMVIMVQAPEIYKKLKGIRETKK